ncbi:SIMPL domain-containing protein [Candidatus Roizmanbacteria bacterium]|nr:SIMPL domain-containing protein [Candidatus Roizmanbacteria bacterium]
MLRDLRIPFFTIIFIFLSFFIFTKVFGPLPFSVNSVTTTKTNLFTIEGTGEATAVPDTALISLGVNKEAATVEIAQNQVNQIINQITADLKKLGIEDKNIKTINYSVNPNYDNFVGSQRINGYSVSANIEARIKPIEKANQAISIATKDGATQVGGVQFVLNDETKKKLEDKARIEAIKTAKTKAQSLANAAGIRLRKIVDVQENNSNAVPQPMFRTMTLDKGAGQAVPPTELNPGENKISITISLSYETY